MTKRSNKVSILTALLQSMLSIAMSEQDVKLLCDTPFLESKMVSLTYEKTIKKLAPIECKSCSGIEKHKSKFLNYGVETVTVKDSIQVCVDVWNFDVLPLAIREVVSKMKLLVRNFDNKPYFAGEELMGIKTKDKFVVVEYPKMLRKIAAVFRSKIGTVEYVSSKQVVSKKVDELLNLESDALLDAIATPAVLRKLREAYPTIEDLEDNIEKHTTMKVKRKKQVPISEAEEEI